MANENFDNFDIVLEGTVLENFSKQHAIESFAQFTQKTVPECEALFDGKPRIIKKNIPHKQAYALQTKLAAMGVAIQIKPRVIQELSKEFSLVPEGEEQTSFNELNNKMAQGEKVICKHCQTVQPLSPYCIECEKQLIGEIVDEGELAEKNKTEFLPFVLVFLCLIFCVLVLLEVSGKIDFLPELR